MKTATPRVLDAARRLRTTLRDFEPRLYSGADCALVAEELALTEKACGAARLLAAARAVDSGAHKEAGVADPVSWLARQGGTTSTQAREALGLARSLDAHPDTKAALLEGAVSLAQAQEIAKCEDEAPGQEEELLALAKNGDLTKLRDETLKRRLSGKKPEDLRKAQLAERRFRHWKDGLGMVRFDGALPPETGIPFVKRIERVAARLRRDAKANGAQERFEAHAADALVALCGSGGPTGKTRTDLVIVCDLYAWRRGHTHEGEVCHLIGGGPIPVELAKELGEDAFLKGVLHDGVEIHTVSHHGRRYTAELRTALDLGPVPLFSGRACAGCGRTWGLEHDHEDPVAHTGPTSYDNLQDLCYPCHQEKTEKDRAAGLLGTKARTRPQGRTGPQGRAGPTGDGPPRGTGEQGGTGPPGRDPPGPDSP